MLLKSLDNRPGLQSKITISKQKLAEAIFPQSFLIYITSIWFPVRTQARVREMFSGIGIKRGPFNDCPLPNLMCKEHKIDATGFAFSVNTARICQNDKRHALLRAFSYIA